MTILDVGKTAEGRIYLVMEKLVGRTVGEELAARGFLPVVEAVALVRQLLDGLDAAHGAGVVHRDVKPANLFLCDATRGPRTLKILDFGVAKIVRRRAGGDGPRPLAHPTAAGAMVGTPRWMAPEQITMQPVGRPTDLYSAGAVLYALVAGRDPFHHHRDPSSVLQAHVDEKPPVPSIGAPQIIPAAVEHAIMKALAKRPEDRWASAAELSDALERALAVAPPVSETLPATLPAPARQTADTTRTMGGGTAIQSAPRADPATPPHALALAHPSGSQLLRRMAWPAVLGAVAVAAVVGTLVGVAIRGRRPHASAPAQALVTAAPAPFRPAYRPRCRRRARPARRLWLASRSARARRAPLGRARRRRRAGGCSGARTSRQGSRGSRRPRACGPPGWTSPLRRPLRLAPPSAAAHRMFGVDQ